MAVGTSATTPAHGTAAIHTLITALCSAGWLVKAWSDATTYTGSVSLSSNPYSGSGSGAGALGNTSAWFRIAAPDGSREWMFQRGANDYTWTVSRSRTGFSGGSPGATTLPTDATTGQAIFSATQLFDSTMAQRWLVSTESSSPYGFVAFTVQTGGGAVRTILFDEPLASGSTETGDDDVAVFGGYYNATGFSAGQFVLNSTSTALGYKRFRHGLASASNVRVDFLGYYQLATNQPQVPATANGNQVASGPINSRETPLRIAIARVAAASSTSTGWCGFANRLRWSTVWSRSNGQTLYDSTNSLYWIYCAGAWVPWDSSTPSI